MKQFHFISGLPRSGSTLLAGLLRQNPKFHAAMSSPVSSLMNSCLEHVGARSKSTGITVASQTRSRHDDKLSQLYERGASKKLFGQYGARWIGVVMSIMATSGAASAAECTSVTVSNNTMLGYSTLECNTLSSSDDTSVSYGIFGYLFRSEGTFTTPLPSPLTDGVTYEFQTQDGYAYHATWTDISNESWWTNPTAGLYLNSDADLTSSSTLIEPINIPSTAIESSAVDVFDFTITDGGGSGSTSDGKSLDVTQVVVNVSGTSTDTLRSHVTWRLNGPDAIKVEGTYNASTDTITFNGLSVSVADGANETYTVDAYMNTNSGVIDNTTFILTIDGDEDLTVSSTGTQMGSTVPVSNGVGGMFEVVATKLEYTTAPAGSVSGNSLSTQPVVTAVDAFGNTDGDFMETITLTEASAGTITGGSVAAVHGVATFTAVNYSATADQQSFVLTANDQDSVDSDLTTADASPVTSDVVATQLVFDTQPVPLSVNSGEATNFSTVPVVSARNGSNVIDTGYSTDIVLAEVNGDGSAIMSATGDTDVSGATVSITPNSGISTFTSMQITYTALGGSSENFNLQASSGALATVNSSQFTGVVDSTQPAVSNVMVPANATYVAGDSLDFTVSFNENVTVNTAGGTPQLAITVGTTTRQATYVSGSGTKALIFSYTVQSGDNDADGIAIGALASNSGTIKDAAGNNSTLILSSVGSTTSIFVDTLGLVVAEVTAVVTPNYDATPNVTISTAAAGTLNVGGSCGSSNEGAISSGNSTITLTKTDNSSALADGTYSDCTIIVTDSLGNSNTPVTLTSFTIDSTPDIGGTPKTQIGINSEYSFVPTVTNVDTNNTLSFSVSGLPDWMTFDSTVGSITGTPLQEHLGSVNNISIIVNNNTGNANATDTLSFSVEVVNLNLAPEAVDDSFELPLNSDNTYLLDVLSNDTDTDGDDLSITGATTSLGEVTYAGDNLTVKMPTGFTGKVELLYTITDGNDMFADASVSLLVQGDQDANAPVITAPENVDVNATGLYTKVDLGVATAVNLEGKPIAISLVDNNSLFKPGKNIVYWQAADDKTELTSIATQSVIVHPLVSLGKNQTVAEGTTASVKVLLNGKAPSYPLSIPFSLSGSADEDDYDIDIDSVDVESGTQAVITISITDDGVVEDDETIVVTLGDVNKGSQSTHTITITEGNVAPNIELSLTQYNEVSGLFEAKQSIKPTTDLAIVNVVTSDINGDNLTAQWDYSDVPGFTLIGESINKLEFEASNISKGTYSVSLTVTDDNADSMSTTKRVYFSVKDEVVELTTADTDGDLIPDNQEGYKDSDSDGIPDYLDAIAECNVLPAQALVQTSFLIEGEAGVCLRIGNTLVDNSTGGSQLSTTDLENTIGLDTEAVNVGGVFDYIATGLPEAGQEYKIVFPQTKPIPTDALYRKYSENLGWSTFVEDARNQLHSSAGLQGYCPATNSAQWSIGLTEGHWCVRLTIEDGGSNDNDGLANGTIVDPGGVFVMSTGNTAPVAAEDTVKVRRSESALIDVLANDSDADNDVLTINSVSSTFGTVTITSDNLLQYQSADNYIGQDTLVYGISDGAGGTDSSKVNLTLYPNTAPQAIDDSAEGDDRTALIINVLANDSDIDGDNLTVTSATVNNGSVSVNSDNTLTFNADEGFDGTALITYTIDDGEGEQATAEVSVTVNAYQSVTVNNKSKGGSMGVMIITLAGLSLYRLRRKRGIAKKTLVQGVAILSMATSAHLAAAEPKWFVTGSVGQSKVSSTQYEPSDSNITNWSVDDTGTSYSIGAGVSYDVYALTLSYEQLGQASASFTGDTLNADSFHQPLVNNSPKLVGGISLLSQYNFWQDDKLSASVGLGLLAWELDYTSELNDNVIDVNKSDVDIFYNLQLANTVAENTQVYIKVSRYNLSVNNVNNISLGAVYQF